VDRGWEQPQEAVVVHRRLLSFTGRWSSGLSFTLILHRRLVDVNEGETAPRECREEDS
jgi:hypothetical protein